MKKILLMIMVMVISQNPKSFAGTGSDEKSAIIKAAGELEYVRGLLEKARLADNKKGSVHLDYDALENDLKLIQDALERHASTPSRTPRKINKITGSYQK
jgi:RAQPRD family integrative conjugative element protein